MTFPTDGRISHSAPCASDKGREGEGGVSFRPRKRRGRTTAGIRICKAIPDNAQRKSWALRDLPNRHLFPNIPRDGAETPKPSPRLKERWVGGVTVSPPKSGPKSSWIYQKPLPPEVLGGSRCAPNRSRQTERYDFGDPAESRGAGSFNPFYAGAQLIFS